MSMLMQLLNNFSLSVKPVFSRSENVVTWDKVERKQKGKINTSNEISNQNADKPTKQIELKS